MDTNKDQWAIIGRGQASWFASWCRRTTYGSISARSNGGRFDNYVRDAAPGCLVYDGSTADDAAYTSHVIRGPMADPSLPPGHVRRLLCSESEPLTPGHAPLGGFDYVATDVFEALLRKVPGVRIGHVADGVVVWSD